MDIPSALAGRSEPQPCVHLDVGEVHGGPLSFLLERRKVEEQAEKELRRKAGKTELEVRAVHSAGRAAGPPDTAAHEAPRRQKTASAREEAGPQQHSASRGRKPLPSGTRLAPLPEMARPEEATVTVGYVAAAGVICLSCRLWLLAFVVARLEREEEEQGGDEAEAPLVGGCAFALG